MVTVLFTMMQSGCAEGLRLARDPFLSPGWQEQGGGRRRILPFLRDDKKRAEADAGSFSTFRMTNSSFRMTNFVRDEKHFVQDGKCC